MPPTPTPVQEPTLFGVPLNRLVAFLGPHIAWLSGAVATWLLVHLHFLATFHIGDRSLSKAIAQSVVFLVVTAVTYAGQHKWLDGFQKWAYGTFTGIAGTQVPGYDPNEFGSGETGSVGSGTSGNIGTASWTSSATSSTGYPTTPPGAQS